MANIVRFVALSTMLLCLLFPQAETRIATGRRCKCIETSDKISSSSNISNIKILVEQDYCPNLEIIVTHKNGRKVCLNPGSPLGVKIIGLMELKKNEQAN